MCRSRKFRKGRSRTFYLLLRNPGAILYFRSLTTAFILKTVLPNLTKQDISACLLLSSDYNVCNFKGNRNEQRYSVQSLPSCATTLFRLTSLTNVPKALTTIMTKHIICPCVRFSNSVSSTLFYQNDTFCTLFLLKCHFYAYKGYVYR